MAAGEGTSSGATAEHGKARGDGGAGKSWRFWLRAFSIGTFALVWNACTTMPGGYDSAAPPVAAGEAMSPRNAPMKPAEERPGLATGYGDELKDPLRRRSFERASRKPAGTDAIYYNDRSGIEAMTGYRRKVGGLQQAAGGMVEWGVKSGFGYATTELSGGRRFVTGSPGKPYSIVVKNRSRTRVEVVLSVDGLDVMDGKPASHAKRGYLIAPGDTLEVKGWRSGWNTVARFEFSSVVESYAERKHGDSRNAGVIGLAVFGEKGVDPWKWMPDELRTRETARPFAEAP